MSGNYIDMWTVQTQRVLDTLQKDGVYYVKKQYVREKYADTAWIFEKAYGFFVKEAEKKIKRPQAAESPVWMYYDKKWAVSGPDTEWIRLRIPCEEILLFDARTWSKILNLSYIGTEQEEAQFAEELRRRGIMYASDVFEQPYYPTLKSEIMKSWGKLFKETCEDTLYLQGATWKIERDWYVEE